MTEREELEEKIIEKVDTEEKLNQLKSAITMFGGFANKSLLNERLKVGPKTKKTLKRRAKNKMASKTRRNNAKNN